LIFVEGSNSEMDVTGGFYYLFLLSSSSARRRSVFTLAPTGHEAYYETSLGNLSIKTYGSQFLIGD
jgi:hypothetical protein